MITARNLQRHFVLPEGTVRAVDGVDLAIGRGDFVAVMGPSGSGKSTLLYLLGAMDHPSAGEVEVAGTRLDGLGDARRSAVRNRSLGFVFQSFQLLARLDLVRNVELPMIYAGLPRSVRRPRAETLLRAFGLGEKLSRFPVELSGGQCQRAAIARALANDPAILLADEPTGSLDSRTGLEVMAIFQALNRRGLTVIMVTHDEAMARHAGRIIRMCDGRIVQDVANESPARSDLPPEADLSLLERRA